LTSGTTPFENLISPFTHNTKENRKILFDQTILLFDSFSSAVRTTNNNSTGKVVIPLGKFQNKWGPVNMMLLEQLDRGRYVVRIV